MSNTWNDVFFNASLDKPLSKQSIGRWFAVSWRSYNDTVIYESFFLNAMRTGIREQQSLGTAMTCLQGIDMRTSSNGNISRVTGPLCGEFTGHRWILLTKDQGIETRNFDVFFDLRPNKRLCKQSRRRWFETPSRPLWRYCNGEQIYRAGLLPI